MNQLQNLLSKAEQSSFSKWKLNAMLGIMVPFNSPHKFKVKRITPDLVETFAAYRKRNFNHLRGIHACAIATIGELAAGLSIFQYFSAKQYRVIMAKMEVEYLYQAKQDLTAICQLNEATSAELKQQLNENDKITRTLQSEVFDRDRNH